MGVEAILYGFLSMRQPEVGPRVNMDTVMLAGYCRPRAGERVIELGCAHGGISLILAKRCPQCRFVGLDIQPHLLDMARENAALNGLEDNTEFLLGDLKDHRRLFTHQSFDVLVTNPPYEDPGSGVRSEHVTNRLARQGEQCTLADVCDAARFLLKNGGRLYMVMRALRLTDTLCQLRRCKLEPRSLRAVHPLPGRKASVFLLEARRSGGPALTMEPPLYIYGPDGKYTEELLDFYRPDPPEVLRRP